MSKITILDDIPIGSLWRVKTNRMHVVIRKVISTYINSNGMTVVVHRSPRSTNSMTKAKFLQAYRPVDCDD